MARKYLQPLSEIIRRATRHRSDGISPECKHFFSGASASVDGVMCISYSPVGFALKLSEADRDTLLSGHGAKALRYFENSPIKREYVVVADAWLDNREILHHWINVSIDHVIGRQDFPAVGH